MISDLANDSALIDQHAERVLPKAVVEPESTELTPIDFYRLFINELHRVAKAPITVDELNQSTRLHKSQLSEWLKRAEEEGLVTKLSRPIRYKFIRSL